MEFQITGILEDDIFPMFTRARTPIYTLLETFLESKNYGENLKKIAIFMVIKKDNGIQVTKWVESNGSKYSVSLVFKGTGLIIMKEIPYIVFKNSSLDEQRKLLNEAIIDGFKNLTEVKRISKKLDVTRLAQDIVGFFNEVIIPESIAENKNF